MLTALPASAGAAAAAATFEAFMFMQVMLLMLFDALLKSSVHVVPRNANARVGH